MIDFNSSRFLLSDGNHFYLTKKNRKLKAVYFTEKIYCFYLYVINKSKLSDLFFNKNIYFTHKTILH